MEIFQHKKKLCFYDIRGKPIFYDKVFLVEKEMYNHFFFIY